MTTNHNSKAKANLICTENDRIFKTEEGKREEGRGKSRVVVLFIVILTAVADLCRVRLLMSKLNSVLSF